MAYNTVAGEMAMGLLQEICRFVGRVASYWGLAPSRCFTAWIGKRNREGFDGV